MQSYVLDDFNGESAVHWQGGLQQGKGTLPDGRLCAALQGHIEVQDLPEDWSAYRSLQLILHNPWKRVVIGGLCLYDQAALDSPDLEYGDYVDHGRSLLLGEGITHVILRIDPLSTQRGNRMLDLRQIRKLTLQAPAPLESEAPLSMACLRLSTLADELDDLALAKPGDAVVCLQHLDIRCYTHQPEDFVDPEEVRVLAHEVQTEMTALRQAIRVAQINGKQTPYANATLLAAEVASLSRPLLAWHFSPNAKVRNLSQALGLLREERQTLVDLLSSRCHEEDEDDSNYSFSLVKPVPDLGKLRIEGKHFLGPDGKPVLVCAMSYHNEGALLEFFAPERHKVELYAVGGGSRYDIESSPVYQAFHAHPNTQRVGWKGWCGHLIKDQWAMGGRKENVVICLENPHILEAIEAYNQQHQQDWVHLPGLAYVILAYELSYLCYCPESIRRFRLWLTQRHGSVEILNEKWGTAYVGFEEVLPPPTQGHGPVLDANRAAWFDWADWNMRRFTDHLKASYQSIRRLHPQMPICTGGSHSMLSANISTTGIDEELIINEVDDVILHEGRDILGIDLFHALAETPKPLVDPEQGGDCSAWFLNYLHGKSTISMFWWPKQPSRQFPRSTLISPVHGDMSIAKVREHLTTALDVRRLSQEITAFWEIPKEVAILYARTTMIQVDPSLISGSETPYLRALRQCYDAARCLDAGISFVSEGQLLAGKACAYKLILLPAVRHLPEAVFGALDAYLLAGGTLVLTPESLLGDEYNRPTEYLAQWGIQVLETHVPAIEGYGESRQRYDQNMERPIFYGPGVVHQAVAFSGDLAPFPLETRGLFQRVKSTGTIAAQGSRGEALLLRIPRGKGQLWYWAGTPSPESLSGLLDQLYDQVGLQRPLRVEDTFGRRIPGLEARLVRRAWDDLVYVANGSGQSREFFLRTDRPYCKIRELRSMKTYDQAQGTLAPEEVQLFALEVDSTNTEKGAI